MYQLDSAGGWLPGWGDVRVDAVDLRPFLQITALMVKSPDHPRRRPAAPSEYTEGIQYLVQ